MPRAKFSSPERQACGGQETPPQTSQKQDGNSPSASFKLFWHKCYWQFPNRETETGVVFRGSRHFKHQDGYWQIKLVPHSPADLPKYQEGLRNTYMTKEESGGWVSSQKVAWLPERHMWWTEAVMNRRCSVNRSWFSFKRSETPLNEVTLCLCLSKLVLTDRAHLTSHHVPPKRAATHVHLAPNMCQPPKREGARRWARVSLNTNPALASGSSQSTGEDRDCKSNCTITY